MVATIFKKTQGGATRRKGAQGQGKTGPKAGFLASFFQVQGGRPRTRHFGGVLVERADQPSRKIRERGCEDTRHGES